MVKSIIASATTLAQEMEEISRVGRSIYKDNSEREATTKKTRKSMNKLGLSCAKLMSSLV